MCSRVRNSITHLTIVCTILRVRVGISEMETNEGEDAEDFVAGDGRVMSQPTLLSLHVLWLREHNRIASQLKTALEPALHSFNDQEKDEVLFQVKVDLLSLCLSSLGCSYRSVCTFILFEKNINYSFFHLNITPYLQVKIPAV